MPWTAVASGTDSLLRGGSSLAAEFRRSVLAGLDDVHVARAATKVARNAAADLRFGRARLQPQQRRGGHHHARRAEAALQAVLLPEPFLQRVELAVLLEALDGLDARAISLNREQGARL